MLSLMINIANNFYIFYRRFMLCKFTICIVSSMAETADIGVPMIFSTDGIAGMKDRCIG